MRHITALITLCCLGAMGCAKSPPPPAPTAKAVAAAPAAYRVLASVEAPGSVLGTVTYAGSTKDTKVTVDRDNATCGSAGEGLSGALIVTDGKVANAVVEIIGVTEGIGFEPTTVKVDNVGCMFVPRVALARVGDTFLSHNSDPVFHNAKLDLLAKGKTKRIANLPVPLQGSNSPPRVLKKPGVVKVSCDAHLWMRSTVYVTTHPYTALTAADGSFKIPDLPAGKYELKVWHEVLGEKTTAISVGANAEITANVAL
ncbi:MAG: carboxypeptidase regulatory-like domain-containing protein [Myxococcota bacterium]